MQFGINLIPKKEVDLQSKIAFNKTRNQILGIILGYILIVIAVFSINLVVVARANAIKGDITKVESELKYQQKKEALVWTITERTDFIDKILKSRNDVVSVFNSMDQITETGGIVYSDFHLTDKKLSLLFTAKDSKSFGDFTEQFKKNLPQFTWVGVSSVIRNKENGYDYLTDILMK